MPRPYTGPKLWLDRHRGTWTILDGKGTNIRTGFTVDERDQAVVAMHKYSEGRTFAPIRPKAPRVYKTPPIKGVYVVGFGPYVKIGISVNVADRMASLQTGAPERIDTYAILEGWAAEEVALHRRFAAYRLNGEWFRREGGIGRMDRRWMPLVS